MKEIYQQTVKDKIQRQNQEFSMEGLRVLDFTYREIPENHTLTIKDENHLVFLLDRDDGSAERRIIWKFWRNLSSSLCINCRITSSICPGTSAVY